jgi:hypothetical protein
MYEEEDSQLKYTVAKVDSIIKLNARGAKM